MKKIIIIVALSILTGLGLAKAEVYSGTHGDNLTWEVNTTTGVLTISGQGRMREVDNTQYPWYAYGDSIQQVVINEGVTTVGKCAFFCYSYHNYWHITSVSLPSTVDSIMNMAFDYAYNLRTITLPANLHYLGESAFSSCRTLPTINIPSTLTKIPLMAFDGCWSLNNLVLPESVVDIDDYAFRDCKSLNTITLGKSIRHIGMDAFQFTPILNLADVEDCIFYVDNYCVGVCKAGIYGDMFIRPGTTLIAEGVFESQKKITSVTLPNSLKYINHSAFSACDKISSITFGDSLLEIGSYAFSSIDSLTQLYFPNSLQRIETYAFNNCSNLSSIRFGYSLKEIEVGAFNSCDSLREIVIPDSVVKIGSHAFDDAIERVTIGKSLVDISSTAFTWSKVKELTWNAKRCKNVGGYPDSFTGISSIPAFKHDSLRSITFGEEVEYIPAGICYQAKNLSSLTLPQSATAIGASAFQGCELLTDIVVPDNVRMIETSAFQINGLRHIAFGKYLEDLSCAALSSKVQSITWNAIHCNDLSYVFGRYDLENISFGDEVEYIPAKLFVESRRLKTLELPASLIEIGAEAFEYCDSLRELSLPENLTTINDRALYCKNLDTVTSPNPVPPSLNGTRIFYRTNAVLRIPCHGFTAYKQSAWNNYFQGYEASGHYLVEAVSADETMGTTTVGNVNCDNSTVQIKAQPKTGFVFDSWSDGVKTATRTIRLTQDTALVATFKVKTFQITFLDWDGSLITKIEVPYNTLPNPPADPIRAATAQYSYTFSGWSPTIVAALRNTTYRATYSASINSYTITWQYEDGSLIDQTIVEYGQMPEHANASQPNTPEFTYTFIGWNPELGIVTGDMTYTAVFDALLNTYLVSFKDYDDSVLKEELVGYGLSATPPENPVREWYYFMGWDRDFSYVTEDMIVTAIYKLYDPTAVDNISVDVPALKLLRNGQIIIVRGDKTYTITGHEVK